MRDGPEANEKQRELRRMYEPYVNALATHLITPLPPWVVAAVLDHWQTSAWARISTRRAAEGKKEQAL
ncbi:MAG TPA: hypothetical protein VM870_03260 [Pyrinomonadaceae bacterium]|nr:hypothetical protein [Pyrinomonadaceae bacterium]